MDSAGGGVRFGPAPQVVPAVAGAVCAVAAAVHVVGPVEETEAEVGVLEVPVGAGRFHRCGTAVRPGGEPDFEAAVEAHGPARPGTRRTQWRRRRGGAGRLGGGVHRRPRSRTRAASRSARAAASASLARLARMNRQAVGSASSRRAAPFPAVAEQPVHTPGTGSPVLDRFPVPGAARRPTRRRPGGAVLMPKDPTRRCRPVCRYACSSACGRRGCRGAQAARG